MRFVLISIKLFGTFGFGLKNGPKSGRVETPTFARSSRLRQTCRTTLRRHPDQRPVSSPKSRLDHKWWSLERGAGMKRRGLGRLVNVNFLVSEDNQLRLFTIL